MDLRTAVTAPPGAFLRLQNMRIVKLPIRWVIKGFMDRFAYSGDFRMGIFVISLPL